jgi:hypothetical protein
MNISRTDSPPVEFNTSIHLCGGDSWRAIDDEVTPHSLQRKHDFDL